MTDADEDVGIQPQTPPAARPAMDFAFSPARRANFVRWINKDWRVLVALAFALLAAIVLISFTVLGPRYPDVEGQIEEIWQEIAEDDDIDISLDRLPFPERARSIEAAHETPIAALEAFSAYTGEHQEMMDHRLLDEADFRTIYSSTDNQQGQKLLQEAHLIENHLKNLDVAFIHSQPLAEQMIVHRACKEPNNTSKYRVGERIVWPTFSRAKRALHPAIQDLGDSRCCLFTIILPKNLRVIDVDTYRVFCGKLQGLGDDRETAYQLALDELDIDEYDESFEVLLPRHLTMVITYSGWRKTPAGWRRNVIMNAEAKDEPPVIRMHDHKDANIRDKKKGSKGSKGGRGDSRTPGTRVDRRTGGRYAAQGSNSGGSSTFVSVSLGFVALCVVAGLGFFAWTKRRVLRQQLQQMQF
eukprot:TRINITY_DN14563_c0_g1_i1.p1 TRINITY_DN14563_c0_g1~~TRINITY_DN14563_c0_g1_i1.p1  ORF type:complete len:413 (-),score=66.44 TRINITY_DN14563_c0_g1_i1:38-1276(-)